MHHLVPISGPVAAWATAYLAGRCGPDDAVEGIRAMAGSQSVVLPDGEVCGWSITLGRLRVRGATAAAIAMAAPGDIAGLPGPPDFNARALAAGECVLVDAPSPLGLVPAPSSGDTVVWTVVEVARFTPPDPPGTASRALAEAMAEGAVELERLDLAAGRDRAEGRLEEADLALASLRLPPGMPTRAHDLLRAGTRLRAAVEAAAMDSGAAVSSWEAQERANALAPLARAWRRALESGFSARPQG